MEKPTSLKVVSIIVIILGVIRVVMGAIALAATSLPSNYINDIIFENLVAGVLILISGLLLLKGNAFGRILFIAATVVSIGAVFIFMGTFAYATLIIFGAIIGVLFFESNIKNYFSQPK